jgi:hypothetical protein
MIFSYQFAQKIWIAQIAYANTAIMTADVSTRRKPEAEGPI